MDRGVRRLFGVVLVALMGLTCVTLGTRQTPPEDTLDTAADLPVLTLPRDEQFLRGIALPLYYKDLSRTYDAPLSEIVGLGADTVSIVVTWAQPTIHDTSIAPDPEESRSDDIVGAAIDAARAHGLRVLLFPILKISQRGPGEWRGNMAPTDVDAWFDSYRAYILHYAELAAAHQVDLFSVGSELGSMEAYEDQWRALIAAVRAVYPGRVLYSANWDHYQQTPFWDAVDVAGLTGYYELTRAYEQPVVEASLVKAWAPIRDELVAWAQRIGRPLVFTEVGYYSQVGTAWHPWDYTQHGAPDMTQQTLCYRAFYEAWADVPALEGVFFWHWFGDGGSEDNSYTPRGKPAAQVIRFWYGQWPPLAAEAP